MLSLNFFKKNWLTNLFNEINTDLSEIWWWDPVNVFGWKHVFTSKSSTSVREWTRDGAKVQKSSIVEMNQNKKQLKKSNWNYNCKIKIKKSQSTLCLSHFLLDTNLPLTIKIKTLFIFNNNFSKLQKLPTERILRKLIIKHQKEVKWKLSNENLKKWNNVITNQIFEIFSLGINRKIGNMKILFHYRNI